MDKVQSKNKYTFNQVVLIMLLEQFVSKCILVLGGIAFRALCGAIMWSADRPAITSGDLPFFLRSWQGWIVILIGIVVLFTYVALDINLAVIMSHKLMKGEKADIGQSIKEALVTMKNFISIRGLLVVLYVAFIAPIVGAPFGISLTKNFAVPDFIMSFISSHDILKVLYIIVTIAVLVWGVMNIFVFHYVSIRKQKIKDALKSSRTLMKTHTKAILKDLLLFVLKAILWFAGIILVCGVLPAYLLKLVDASGGWNHFAIIFIGILLVSAIMIYLVLFLVLGTLRITGTFGKNDEEIKGQYIVVREGKKKPWIISAVALVAVIAITSGFLANNFEEVFPPLKDVKIIAHRGGGDLAHENTVFGVQAAILHGAFGTETDIQRTKDGQYIINHDNDFSRLCGVEKKPSEMTLAEIKELNVKFEGDSSVPATKVPTLEEFLDAGKDKIHFYLELKGESADRKMADDVYQMIKAKGMLDQCCFIGLDYDLIKYVDQKYDDLLTGYLCFFSVGEIEDLSCEILMPEMETATTANIDKINEVGKWTDVWTVNTYNAMFDFLTSDADGIVTDKVSEATAVKKIIQENSDLFRIINFIFN